MTGFLDELQAAVTAAAERVGPAVIGLGRGWGRGSGVVIADGRVITNAHVLRGDEVAVKRPGRRVRARPRRRRGRRPRRRRDRRRHGRRARRSRGIRRCSRTSRPGQPVFALADPGGRGLRTTFGLVTATGRSFRGPRGRRIGGSIEHSAPLPRGSSGGPLVDAEGRLLGLNSVRMEGGLVLALPADAALRARIDALGRGEAPARPRLGAALAPPRAARKLRAAVGLPERDGLLVRAVEPGSPADRAGRAARRPAGRRGRARAARLRRAVRGARRAPATSLALTVVRGTEERVVDARFSK